MAKNRKNITRIIVGLCGMSGSGKTTLARMIEENHTNVSLLTMDHYYLPLDEQKKDENGWTNFDLPTSLNHQACYDDLQRLRNGKSVSFMEYVFNNETEEPQEIVVESAKIILVEGLFLFHDPQINQLFDMRMFVDTSNRCLLVKETGAR